MLTIAAYKNESQVESYFNEHLSSDDYHSEDGKVLGQWVGTLTETFGLSEGQGVTKEAFSDIVKGINPKTKNSYLIRKKSNRIVAREMLFSAPKSVSIMAITMQDSRLLDAHLSAVSKAFKTLEELAQSKIRKGLWINADDKRTTGSLLAARFTHETSRTLDPQLHTHNVVFNVTFDKVENRLKALDPHFIYNSTGFISEIYRSELAKSVKQLGYQIEEGRHTWRIKGVSKEVETKFSKRAAQIERAATKLKAEKGVEVDTRGRALLASLTRKKKDHTISEEDYLRYQQEQLTKEELADLNQILKQSLSSKLGEKQDSKEVAKEAINYALHHVFERASVVHKHDLIKEALKYAKGGALLEDVKLALNDPRFLHRGDFVMTREERELEVRLLQLIRSGKRQFDPLVSNQFTFSETTTLEQKKAISQIVLSHDKYIFLRGPAGAGKTYTLKELSQIVGPEKMAYLAPSSSAVENLKEEGFFNSITLQKYLLSKHAQNEMQNKVIVVDEAGLMSTRQMDLLLKVVNKSNARVLLVGDTLQHNSVEGGDALRLIEDYSVIEKASLQTITRQKITRYNEAVTHLSKGDVFKGWNILDQMEVITEVGVEERAKLVANDYIKSINDGLNTLVVCPTWQEIDRVTIAIRDALKTQGLVSQEEVTLATYQSKNFTRIEKSYCGNYDESLSISFHSDRDGFRQGEIWRIKEVSKNTLFLVNDKGNSLEIDPKNYSNCFDVVSEKELSVAKGDKILIKANYATSPENRLANGALAKISHIHKNGEIELENGKVLAKTFRHFTYGYAVTSQSSQGKSVDKVILSMNANEGLALSKNQFYVSVSRGKHAVSIYTNNKEDLKHAVERSSARALVTEALVRDRIVMKGFIKTKVVMDRAVEKSRDLIEKAFHKWGRFEKERQRNKSKSHFKSRVGDRDNEYASNQL